MKEEKKVNENMIEGRNAVLSVRSCGRQRSMM